MVGTAAGGVEEVSGGGAAEVGGGAATEGTTTSVEEAEVGTGGV